MFFTAVIAKDGPMITGGKANYKVGDLLNVNCSSTKSRPAPQLHWYLNEEMVNNSFSFFINIMEYLNK